MNNYIKEVCDVTTTLQGITETSTEVCAVAASSYVAPSTHTLQEIATILGISKAGVHAILERVKRKVGVESFKLLEMAGALSNLSGKGLYNTHSQRNLL